MSLKYINYNYNEALNHQANSCYPGGKWIIDVME